jgi:uncharacterized membrane protein YkgB
MSHHFDTKLAKEDPSLNVCDLYLFQGAPDTTVMAMTVNPDLVLSAPDTLHVEGLYAFRLDLNGDAREDVVFKFRFNEPRHVNGDEHVHVQKFQVRRATGEAVAGDLLIWQGEANMNRVTSGHSINAEGQDLDSSSGLSRQAESNLTKFAAWISDRNVPFLITSIGMIVMLLWAGSYKMTAPGAEGIIPLVSNSPLISWHFKLFGPYVGSDLIGLTEITAAILMIAGYLKPKAGIIGGLIACVMFFVTSTMVITTPEAIIAVHGISHMRYMSFLGLFLFKDVISLGVSFYLISYFGHRAILFETHQQR